MRRRLATRGTDAPRSETPAVVSLDQKRRQRRQLEGASREAEGYLELGMHEHALQALQRRGRLVHSDAHACYLMGESLRELRRFREAVYPLRRSVSLRPDDVPSWLALGWCYKRTGRLEMAIESLERALAETPEEPMLLYNLACYYSLAGRGMTALRTLRRALALDASLGGLVKDESDFDPLRADPALRMLLLAIS